eukprot:SAG22_NODE_1178_length_5239_cov_67.095136_4_plen_382_part_00
MDPELFPTTEDVALYIAHNRYRWQPPAADPDSVVQASRALILDGDSPGVGSEGPTNEEIMYYMISGGWREAQLFNDLRPTAAHLEAMASALDLDAQTVRAVMLQLRHTDENPLGAANAWALPGEGEAEFDNDKVVEHLKQLSVSDFAKWFPSSSDAEIRRLRQGLLTSEWSEEDRQSIQTVSKVLLLTDALAVAYPHDFSAGRREQAAGKALPTDSVSAMVQQVGGEAAVARWAAAVEAAPEKAEWTFREITAAIGGASAHEQILAAVRGGGGGGDADAAGGDGEYEEEGEEGGEADEEDESDGGATDGAEDADPMAVTGAAVLDMDVDEFSARLRAAVEAGDRGDMLLALDMLGISVSSFRSWLKTGVVPHEWGGPNLSP